MQWWKLLLIILLVLGVSVGLLIGASVLANKIQLNRLKEHKEHCGGHFNLAGADRYGNYYECDKCGRIFALYSYLPKDQQ